MKQLAALKRNDELSWELAGDGPRAVQVRTGARFAVGVFEGHAAAFSDTEGAAAFAATLVKALETPTRIPAVRLDLFRQTDDPVLADLRVNALDVLVVGAIALARTGHDLERLAPDLVRFAGDPTPDAIELRRVMLGDLPFGPDPRLPQDFLRRIEDFLKQTCVVGVQKALNQLAIWARPTTTTDANGITSLAPSTVCAGDTFKILGSGFGRRQPQSTKVLVPAAGGGWKVASVVSWSDTEIAVKAPPGVGPGCVGFVRQQPIEGPIPESVVNELEHCFGPSAGRWDKLDQPKLIVGDGPPCLTGDANRLSTGGLPVIQSFWISPGTIEPGQTTFLTWTTTGATKVSIREISNAAQSQAPVPLGPPPLSGSLLVGPFSVLKPVTLTYELAASNACGTAYRFATVAVRARAKLSIVRVEVVQSVQRPDNSIRLVAGQRTALRVFVDSGIRSGFDSGAGPNELTGVQVTARALPMPTGPIVTCPGPWDATAHAKASHDRNLLRDSFNIDVPVAACTGTVRFEVTARISAGLGSIDTSIANSAAQVTFVPKAAQELLPILITDSVNPNPTPTLSDYLALLAGPRARQPFTDAGFAVNPALSWSTGGAVDLHSGNGWNALLLRLVLTAFVFPSTPVGGIRTAAVANDPAYPWGGLAWPRIGLTVPGCICCINQPDTFAHELGHTYGLLHVNCGGAAGPYGGLPLNTDEPGLDVRDRTLVPAGGSELMSYCSSQWVSTLHWDFMFNSVPIS
jgi:hypothetical protein